MKKFIKYLSGYFKHKDTSVHIAPRYIGSKIYNRLHHCETKFCFKISSYKSIQMNECWERPLFSKCKIVIFYGKNNTIYLTVNITHCASELLQKQLYNIDS